MTPTTAIQEIVRFGEDGRLCGVLHYPAESQPLFSALLCSPHPNFAGDMDNNVIRALADGLAERALVLRFDYRGIGQSRIDLPPGLSVFDYWEEVEQGGHFADPLGDATAAAKELGRIGGDLPMFVAGFSFGAVMAAMLGLSDRRCAAIAGISPPLTRVAFDFLAGCPRRCLLVSGEDDFVYDPQIAARLVAMGGSRLRYERLERRDHFFRGCEADVVRPVVRFAAESTLGALEEVA